MRSRVSMSIQSRAFVFCLIKVLSKVFSFLPLFSLQRARAIMREHSHADAAPSPALWSRSVLTVQSQVQCCLALTLRFKHWLQSIAGDMRSGAAISALSQWQTFLLLPLSDQSLVCYIDEVRCKYPIQWKNEMLHAILIVWSGNS